MKFFTIQLRNTNVFTCAKSLWDLRFANSNISQIRSSGITDSRYGYVVTSIWLGKHRFKRSPYLREPLPLPAGVNGYSVAATTSSEHNELSPVRMR